MKITDLKEFLDYKILQYNTPEFVHNDPVSIPHLFSKKEDVEISGFLTAIIAWGNRKAIIKAAMQLMELMDHSPFDFVMNAGEAELTQIQNYYYRTFRGCDLGYFLTSLKNIYSINHGIEHIFTSGYLQNKSIWKAISNARQMFFSLPHPERTEKHFSSPLSGSACKRINMFLRWMVRNDPSGIDFGIWNGIPASALLCPLDLHTGNVARKLGLIHRKQNDRQAVDELMTTLRAFDPDDPVKYDFALFGLGVFEKF
jgi:uncharacterized protein (TIGR02757 family)